MLSTPRFTLQNIIQLLHHMDHPMILCDSSLRTVYSNAAFNRHYGEAYASLDVLATAASRSRIQQARDAGQTIDVSCERPAARNMQTACVLALNRRTRTPLTWLEK